MVKSMTGFGRGEAANGALKAVVEVSAVNRKQLDCSISLPRELLCLEAKVQLLVRRQIARGYVKGAITLALVRDSGTETIDITGLEAQIGALRALAARLGLADDLTASALLRLPDALRPRLLPENPEECWPLIEQALHAALQQLTTMRLQEGTALQQDLSGRLVTLETLASQIAKLAPGVPVAYRRALERRLSELLDQGSVAAPELLAREVAIFADRCDVSEELTRLDSHFAQFRKLLEQGGTCGRALDFLCQELFREINTIGSKANDAAIARLVIDFKAGLEAVREQVQNIE